MVKKNNFVRFTWKDYPDEGRFLREVEHVMKKEKPKQVPKKQKKSISTHFFFFFHESEKVKNNHL